MSAADTVTLSLSGLSCAGCVRKVETALAGEPGVDEAAVNFATSSARVSGEALNIEGLIAAIEQAGFHAAVQETTPDRRDREARARLEETRTARQSLLVAALLTAPVFALEMGGHVIPGVHGLIET
ncbi:MAG: heavy metal-associated domain-containing protein, partial [Kangiellaceae bacterium]|nr:heavy metal-associated domain-containing protein [Kangiellaceae bacterium]